MAESARRMRHAAINQLYLAMKSWEVINDWNEAGFCPSPDYDHDGALDEAEKMILEGLRVLVGQILAQQERDQDGRAGCQTRGAASES